MVALLKFFFLLLIQKDVTFLNTGEALIINNEYTVLSAPTSWGLSSNEIFTVDDASVKKFISTKRDLLNQLILG